MIIVVLVLAFLAAASYSILGSWRRAHPDGKYVPSFLKRPWRSWNPRLRYEMFRRKDARTSSRNLDEHEISYNPSIGTSDGPTRRSTEITSNEAGMAGNRNSVRSIMTLPPYRPSPHPSEHIIAREGERAGVDTVIEFPETVDEEEARREEDMEALYQIRQARRAENAARQDRRRQRQEARDQGDWARLEQLRLDSQMRARARADSAVSSGSNEPNNNSSTLIAEHNARTSSHDRRVSSVSYADLGLARHDGSRLRASSTESDHRPLLEGAAGMGHYRDRSTSRPSSLFRMHTPHNRAASASSLATNDSDAQDTPFASTHGERSGSDPPVHTPSGSSNGPSPPTGEPPGYEDAPPYTSPVSARGEPPRLSTVESVPAIEVTAHTPVGSAPVTPVDMTAGEGRGRR